MVYYSIGFTKSASNQAQIFNAGFVKPTLYNIYSRLFCLMFLIDAIKPYVEKKFKACFIFTRLFRGRVSGATKIKPVLFLFVFGLLAATKTLFKRNENKYLSFIQLTRNTKSV